jgi:hypothetical protein
MTVSKKAIELWRLERFKTLIRDFPAGDIEPTEEPDFLIRGPEHIVGIELTDLHRETKAGQVPEQATEAMRSRVVARAQGIYNSRELPPVIASFFLDDRIHLKKHEVEDLASQMADLVEINLPSPGSTSKAPKDWEDTQALPSIVHSCSVHRLDAITRTHFSSPGATWVASLTREDIERALYAKNSKYATYRKKCDECWLVINADIESMATWFEFEVEVFQQTFTTSFDRVFLVQHFGGKAHELALKAGGA